MNKNIGGQLLLSERKPCQVTEVFKMRALITACESATGFVPLWQELAHVWHARATCEQKQKKSVEKTEKYVRN